MTPRPTWPLTTLIVILSSACSQKPPEPVDLRKQSLYQYRMDGGLFSPDEKRVLFDRDANGAKSVFVFDTQTGGATQVTKGKTPAHAISFFPGNGNILFSANPPNESVEHLFMRSPDGSETDLTPWPGVEAQFYCWDDGKRSFYFGSNKDDRRFMYIYRIDVASKAYSLVLQTQDMQFAAASKDGLRLALWKYSSPVKSQTYLYDFQSKALNILSLEQPHPVSIPQVFDATKDALYYLTDGGPQFLSLARYDLDEQRSSTVLRTAEPIVFARQSSNRRYFVLGVERAGGIESKLFDTTTEPWSEVTLNQPLLIHDISPSGRYLIFGSGAATQDFQLYDLQTKSVRRIQAS